MEKPESNNRMAALDLITDIAGKVAAALHASEKPDTLRLEDILAKAELAHKITQIIERRGLTQELLVDQHPPPFDLADLVLAGRVERLAGLFGGGSVRRRRRRERCGRSTRLPAF